MGCKGRLGHNAKRRTSTMQLAVGSLEGSYKLGKLLEPEANQESPSLLISKCALFGTNPDSSVIEPMQGDTVRL